MDQDSHKSFGWTHLVTLSVSWPTPLCPSSRSFVEIPGAHDSRFFFFFGCKVVGYGSGFEMYDPGFALGTPHPTPYSLKVNLEMQILYFTRCMVQEPYTAYVPHVVGVELVVTQAPFPTQTLFCRDSWGP